jgi:dipeptidyl aminopeptidase/acylaminoacyl peptidase
VATTVTRAPASDELTRSVERLAGVGSCSTPSFSPDGAQLAFISDLSGSPQVWTVPFEGGWPQRVTAFPDQVTNAIWSPTDDLIAVEVAPGGGLDQQVYVVRPDGSDLRRLTPGGKENNRLVLWTRDGRTLFVLSNRDDASRFDAFAVDVATSAWRPIGKREGITAPNHTSRDGRRITLTRVVARGDSNAYLLADGIETLLTPHPGETQYFAPRFVDDEVWLMADQGRETLGLARVVTPGKLEYLATRDDAELDGWRTSDDDALYALKWNVAGVDELEVVERASGKRTRIALPAERTTAPVFSHDGKRMALVIFGSNLPIDIWAGEVGGRLRQITHSPHPGVDLTTLVRPRVERFTAHDGLGLSGLLYVPREFRSPGPVVLSFHGGPEGQERPFFNPIYQALLANGIAVFAPNVRGSTGFGKTFMHLDDRDKRFDGVRDIQACVDHVVKSGVADAKRIGITGGSYGGYMTMAGITEFPDMFAGAVCVCGIINFLTFFKHTQPWMAAVSKSEYGDPDTERDLLERLSPINKIDRAKTPLLVLHGANDTNVPLVEATQMVDELRKRNVPVEAVIFPDEGHGFTKTANRTRAAVETVRHFAKYL